MSELTPKQREAAQLLALDELSREKIAEKVGVSRRTLYNWLEEPDFRAEVERQTKRLASDILPTAIRRLKHNISKGEDKDANTAIQIALKMAGWLEPKRQEPSRDDGLQALADAIRESRESEDR